MAQLPGEAVGVPSLKSSRPGWMGSGQPELVGGSPAYGKELELDDL